MNPLFTEDFLEKNIEHILAIGTKLLRLVAVFIICILLIKISRSIIRKFFEKQAKNQKIPLDERKARTMNSILFSLVKYSLYFIAAFTMLTELGIDEKSLIAIAGAGSVAIGLGAQNMIQDMLDGFFIVLEDRFAVGDIVSMQGVTGTVESISLRTTKIRDSNGAVHSIPNGSIGIISNMSKDYMNAVVDILVDYKEPTQKVLEILKEEALLCQNIKGLLEVPQVLGVAELGEWGVTIRIIAKCAVTENWPVERELRLRMKTRLEQENISLAHPPYTFPNETQVRKE
jgi:small-conductance mechanosensitive channel